MASGKGASRWLVLTRVSTGWLMLPTNTMLADAWMASRPRAKDPEAMKSFMIWTPSLSLKEMPATSSKATTSHKPTSPTTRRAML